MPSAESRKPSKLKSAVGLVCIAGIVAYILLARTPAVNVDGVTARLQQFAAELNRQAGKVGRQAALSYGTVTVEGIGYDKYVVVQNLRFSLSARPGRQDGDWTLETAKASVTADPLNARRVIFTFADPVTLTQNGSHKTIITASQPLKFGYFDNNKPDALSDILLTFRLPPEIKLAAPADVGQPPAPFTISYDGMPDLSVHADGPGKLNETKFEVRNVIAQPSADQQYDIGAIAANINEKKEASKLDGNITFTVSDFIRRVAGKAVATCSLTAAVGYDADESLMGLFGIPDTATAKASLRKFIVACDEFTLKLEGEMTYQPGDSLPSGAMTLSIDNVRALLGSAVFSDQMKSELASALPRITGQPNTTMGTVAIPVKRDPNGALMLGAISAQDAGITALSQWFPAK